MVMQDLEKNTINVTWSPSRHDVITYEMWRNPMRLEIAGRVLQEVLVGQQVHPEQLPLFALQKSTVRFPPRNSSAILLFVFFVAQGYI